MTKDKSIAGLLALFGGGLGLHYFYLHRIAAGVLSILFCWTGIPSLLGLINGIRYFCMSEREFANCFGLDRDDEREAIPMENISRYVHDRYVNRPRRLASSLRYEEPPVKEEEDEEEEEDEDEVRFKKLERLNDLHKEGALSDEEFEREKRRLFLR